MLMTAFVIGLAILIPTTAQSDPKTYEDQRQYAQVLNPLATRVMRWYGYLVMPKHKQSREMQEGVNELFATAGARSTYRQRYPARIRNIDLLDAGLARRGPNRFAFRIESHIFYWLSHHLRRTRQSETFVFVMTDPQRPRVVTIEREKGAEETRVAPTEASERGDILHYQLRRFAYAWLAHMDRDANPSTPRFTAGELERASYEVEFGAMTFRGDVDATLKKRRHQQGSGGHLLRSLTVLKRHGNTRHMTIELIMDWKGKSPGGRRAIGKIRQEISLTISDGGQIEVAAIREKHLLPDLEPWTKLLC